MTLTLTSIPDFDALFRQHYSTLVLYGMKYLGGREEAREIVQEIFIHLFERRKELTIRSNPKSYLFQAVRNRCLNELEKMKTEKRKQEAFQREIPTEYAFSDPLEAAEFEARLFRLIEGLPPACRAVFRLSRFEGKSNSEIAAEMDLSRRTVETQISKALRTLRKALYGSESASALKGVLHGFLL
ncbi:MAG TPA: RNA polymerase sigma-70 factor [Bacteroidetes bacterium]|nr:RNA polymerase sigma-70 factor [Bacteroidota bacterium]